MESLSPFYAPTPSSPTDNSNLVATTEWVNAAIDLVVDSARFYDTRAAAAAAEIPTTVTHLYTGGYSTPGDFGGALYKRVATQPTHAAKIQSADGAWWALAQWPINPIMFGAKGDNATDDKQALIDMFAYVGVQASPNFTQSWPVTGLGLTYCTSVPLAPPSFIDLHNINFRALAGAQWAGGNGSAFSWGNKGVLTLNGGFQRLNNLTVDCGRIAGCQGIFASGPNYQNIWSNILVKHWTTNGNGIVLNNYSLTEARNIDCLQFMDGDPEYKIASYRAGVGMLLASQADSIFISCNWANSAVQLYVDGQSHFNRFQDCHPYCVSDGHATTNQEGIICDGSWNTFDGTYLDVCTFRIRNTAQTMAGYPAITITNTICLYNPAHSTFGAWFIFEAQLANTPLYDIKMSNNHTASVKPFSFIQTGSGTWAASAKRIQTLNAAVGDAELHEPGGATSRFMGSIDMLGVGYLTGYTTTSITDTANARTLSVDDSGKLILMTLNNAITITAPKSIQTGLDCYIYCPNHAATIIAEGGGSINGQTTGIPLEQNKLYKLICYYGTGTNAQYGLMGLGGSGGSVDLTDYYTKEASDARFQPLDTELTALAGLVPAPNKLIYYDDTSTPALASLSAFTRGLLDNTSAAEWRSDLGVALGSQIQAWDIVLDILSSVSPAADTIPYFTDSGHGDTTAFTQVGRDIVGSATTADAQNALGLLIGSQVQAYGDNLEAIRGLPTQADTISYWTGTGDASLTTLTPWARGWLGITDSITAAAAIGAQTHYATLDWLGTLEVANGQIMVGTDSGLAMLGAGADGKLLVSRPAVGGGMDWEAPSAALFGFGDIANQASDNVDITGGSIVGLSSLQAGTVESGNIQVTGGSISGVTITGLPDPVDDQDAATKKYVTDSIGSGTTDPQLLALAALEPTANTVPIFTNDHTAALMGVAPWAQGFLFSAVDAVHAQVQLGLVPDSQIMAYDPNLVSISALSHAKGNLMVGTGSAWDVLEPDPHDGWVLQIDGSQPSGFSYKNPGTFGIAPVLENLANLPHAANQLPLYTGDQTWTAIDTSSYGRGLMNMPDAASLVSNLGLVIGNQVQPHSSVLDQISGWTKNTGDLLIGNGGSVGVLGIGSDHQFLMADSTVPGGVRWYDLALDVELPSSLTALANLNTAPGGLLHYTDVDAPELLPITPYSSSLFTGSNAAAWQSNLGLTIDGTVQRHNGRLDAIAALGWDAHKGIVLTGSGSLSTFDLTDPMISLLGSADNDALLSTLGLTIGESVQAWHAGLDDLGSLAPAQNGTLAVWKDGHWVTFAPGDDTQILQANSLAEGGVRWIDLFSNSSGGEGALPEALSVLGTVIPAANRLPYFDTASTAAVTPFTDFARTLLDDIDASHARTTLGLGIGSDIQAHSTKLDALDGLTLAANKGIMATGSNALGTFDLTPFAQTLLDDADAATMRATLGLGSLSAQSLMPRGYLAGMKLSNNATTPNTKVDIAIGSCRDDTDVIDIKSTAALTVDFGVVGANGLASGAIAANTWYHVFAIMKSDGTIAGLASTSMTPALPTGYTYRRRLGSVKTNASSQILAFTQQGDSFLWKTTIKDFDGGPSTVGQLHTMSVPPGVVSEWSGNLLTNIGTNIEIYFSCPDVNNESPDNVSLGQIWTLNGGSAATMMPLRVRTNTAGQIRSRATGGSGAFRLQTYGYLDRRGQDD